MSAPAESKSPALVSACLLGVRCRYDGCSKSSEAALALVRSRPCVPVCPEQLGGLPTPRPKSHLTDGDGRAVLAGEAKVVNDAGEDVTAAFVRGARECVELARRFGAREAFLKQRSPSCGCGVVRVSGEMTEGLGVAAAALEQAGLRVVAVD